jgi:hypothetical protein
VIPPEREYVGGRTLVYPEAHTRSVVVARMVLWSASGHLLRKPS